MFGKRDQPGYVASNYALESATQDSSGQFAMSVGRAAEVLTVWFSRTVRPTMGHILDKSKGEDDSAGNLKTMCTNCNEGLQNTALPKPDRVHLLSQIRRATISDQEAVLEWLLTKFKSRRNL